MATFKFYSKIAKDIFNSSSYLEINRAHPRIISWWLHQTSNGINALSHQLKGQDLHFSKVIQYQSLLANLISIKHKILSQLKQGAGITRKKDNKISNRVEGAEKQKEVQENVTWSNVQTALENRISTGVITNHVHKDIDSFIKDVRKIFKSKIKSALKNLQALKVYTELTGEYVIIKDDGELVDCKYFTTKSAAIYDTTELNEWFDINVKEQVKFKMHEFQQNNSGWSLRSILNLMVFINKLNPLRGSSFIPLPDYIKNKKACVNVRNEDNQCFKWAVLSALFPVESEHKCRVSSYRIHENKLKFNGIEFPVMKKDISKFEKLNNISINLFILHKKGKIYGVSPTHLTARKMNTHINLLYLQDYYADENDKDNTSEYITENESLKYHYIWIKNLSRLVRTQLTNHHQRSYICDRCLHYFHSSNSLENHEKDCSTMNKCSIKLPEEGKNILKFTNFHRKLTVPFVIYADFECMLEPVRNGDYVYQRHKAYSVGFYLKCSYDNSISVYKSYRQKKKKKKTAAEWFVKALKDIVGTLESIYENPLPKNLSEKQIDEFLNAKTCHICEQRFTISDIKVQDHCHLTSIYRGAAHNSCNLRYQDSTTIPVIFHGLTAYDSHLFIVDIARSFPGRISLVPQTKERYISFTKYIDDSNFSFRFIDSFRFMSSSLEKLASYLEEFNILEKEFSAIDSYTPGMIKLLKRKGVFPYDYIKSFETLKQTVFPSKTDFYNKLNDTDIIDNDYSHAKEVWNTFNIKDLGAYSDLYMKTDVLLLADVFENFRHNCIKTYNLDPAHYYTSPALSWDAMLKYTKIRLELFTEIDMLLFVERGIRGGVSQCCNRYAKANNKYMNNGYDESKESSYLMYYDVNNLYGFAMTMFLPFSNFKWVTDLETNFYLAPNDSSIGYILEVDLEYPKYLHDKHKDLPFCPEHVAAPGSKQKKLMTTLYDKKRYVVHYIALKQALEHGLRLRKVHRALSFSQKPWLKPYIDLNSNMRKAAKNEFEKHLFKLFNNSVFGKTMENQRKHLDVKLVSKWDGRYGAEALIARPNFNSSAIFDENLVAVQLSRTEIILNKPIYIGLSILDISKTCVYRFHYDYIKDKIHKYSKLLYTDTDSLIYEIKNVDIYRIMRRDIDEFDTSDYPKTNQFEMPLKNRKVVGKMKDECNGKIMLEFVGLRSKLYSFEIQGQETIKKARGVKGATVRNTITFNDYLTCLYENKSLAREEYHIRSRNHHLQTEKQTKIALSSNDDKRYLIPKSTDTLPWGHYSINSINKNKDDDGIEVEIKDEQPQSKRVHIEKCDEGEL